ncbi:MAG TPA: gluconokinase [Chloroflexota bacterium]
MAARGEPPFVLALDVGTSSTRALAYDARGRARPAATARAGHRLTTTPDGGAFLDPDELLQTASGCLEQARKGLSSAPLAAMAMDCFWHSLIGVDDSGEPLTPVLTWADTRASKAAEELRGMLDEAAIHARTGCRLHASYWPAKLRWLAHSEPAAYRRTKRWMSFGEYVQWRLTGELVCSLSMASGTGLLDVRTCQWDAPLLEALRLDPERLSPLVDVDHPLPGFWLPAVGDGASSNIGSGCSGPDRLALNMGTSSALRVVKEDASGELPMGLWKYRVDRRRALIGGALSEGGNLWAWLRSMLRLPSLRATEAELAAMSPDAHGLTVLPFVAGERSTGWHADARLTVSGVSLATRPVELLRAALEAVAYRLAAVHEQLEPFAPGARIVASGTAMVGSATWAQVVADVLGQPVQVLNDPEVTARGAALLALEALGHSPDPQLHYEAIFEPDSGRHARYQQARARQRALYERLTTT